MLYLKRGGRGTRASAFRRSFPPIRWAGLGLGVAGVAARLRSCPRRGRRAHRHPAAGHPARRGRQPRNPGQVRQLPRRLRQRRRARAQLARQHDGQRRPRPDLLGDAGDRRAGLRRLRRPLHPLSQHRRLARRALHAHRRLGPGERRRRRRRVRLLPRADQSRRLGAPRRAVRRPSSPTTAGPPRSATTGAGWPPLWGGNEKLGPYADTNPQAPVHCSRSSTARWTSAAPATTSPTPRWATWRTTTARRHGATRSSPAASPGRRSTGKAAFNNFPYQYGVVERTFSEYKSGQLVETRVADYASLPDDLKAGAIAGGVRELIAGRNRRRLRRRGPPLLQLPDLPHAPGPGAWMQQERHARAQRSAAARHDRRQLLDAGGHPLPGRPGQAAGSAEDSSGVQTAAMTDGIGARRAPARDGGLARRSRARRSR